MRRCVFCSCMVDVGLWIMDDVADDPVPACRSCAEQYGLGIVLDELDAGASLEHDTCHCCGRELPSPRSWPMIVWVRDGRRLMAVCNACRTEYGLRAVFASAPPTGWRVRRRPESQRDEPGT